MKTLKKDKLVFNEDYNEFLGVAVLAIERVKDNEVHFVLNFGGGKEIRFVGQSEWQKFLDFARWFDWNPINTDTWEMSQIAEDDEDLPFAEEICDDTDTWERTIVRCCGRDNCANKINNKRHASTTLKLKIDDSL